MKFILGGGNEMRCDRSEEERGPGACLWENFLLYIV